MSHLTITTTVAAIIALGVSAATSGTAFAQQPNNAAPKRSVVSGSLQRSGPVGYRVRAEVVRLKDDPATPQVETDANIISQIRYEVSPIAADPAQSAPELIKSANPGDTPGRGAAADAPAISLSVTDDGGTLYRIRDFFLSDENIASPINGAPVFGIGSAQAVLELLTPEGLSRLRPDATRIILNINTQSGSQKLSYKLAQADK